MDLRNFPGSLLITGVTGFIGGTFARRLLAEGFPPARLRCLVRDRSLAADRTGVPGGCLVDGDLEDADSLARAARGIDVTVHLAGATRSLSTRGFDRANAAGTASLVEVLSRHAPGSRLVHVSSLAAAGPSVDGVGSDSPPDRCAPVSIYGESKRRGELAALGAPGLNCVVLRPPIVYGPQDPATRLLIAQASGPVVGVPRRVRPLSIVHVDDVCDVLRGCALGTLPDAALGACLPIDGPDRTDTDRLVLSIAAARGRSVQLVRLPDALLGCAARGADLWSKWRGRPHYFSRDKVREITAAGWVANGRPLAELLGLRAHTPLRAGLAALCESLGS